jgi:prepilin-type N-terminal cleavage/methylation domain-containing protein
MKIFRSQKGFTLIELMIALVLLSLIVAAIISIFINSQKAKRDSELVSETQQTARVLIERIAEDIRTAGYGANAIAGHDPIVYAGPFDIMLSENLAPYPDDPENHGFPLAINPLKTPLPGGGLYTPATFFDDGTETIRYSFDTNNDGTITTGDRGDDLEERLSRNTNLYCIARHIFGYDTLTKTNGGSYQALGLARSNFPAVSAGETPIPPLFVYYYYDQATGRDKVWGDLNGDSLINNATEINAITAVPAAQRKNITKVGINITTQTRSPNSKNRYETITMNSVATITRNRPLVEGKMISGRVGIDANTDNALAVGEAGLDSIFVMNRSDGQVTYTNSNGEYSFSVEPKVHNIVASIPALSCGASVGYKAVLPVKTDVMVDATTTDQVQDFPLQQFNAGSVSGVVYFDINDNGTYDAGTDPGIPGSLIYAKEASRAVYTGSDGSYCLASEVGSDSLICKVAVSDPIYVPSNPIDSKAYVTFSATASTQNFGFVQGKMGAIKGKVFKDLGTMGLYENEAGIAGVSILLSQGNNPLTEVYENAGITDELGEFVIPALVNADTNYYSVTIIPPGGYIPTTPIRCDSIVVTEDDTLGPYYFGLSKLNYVSLEANRVLCMTINDLWEWEGPTTANPSHYNDMDIVLGAQYVDNNNANVRGWFNKRYWFQSSLVQETDEDYLFETTTPSNFIFDKVGPAYSDIMAIASDTMDHIRKYVKSGGTTTPTNNYMNSRSRRDVVIGLSRGPSASDTFNVVVWPTENDDSSTTLWGRIKDFNTTNIPTSSPNFRLTAKSPDFSVRSIVLGNFAGDGFPEIVAGYSTDTVNVNAGGFVMWVNDSLPYSPTATGTYYKEVRKFTTRLDFPPTGYSMGAVMALARDTLVGTTSANDTRFDLVVGTKIGDAAGKIRIFKGVTTSPYLDSTFNSSRVYDAKGAVMGLKIFDINSDNKLDIVAVVKTSTYKGQVQVWLQNSNRLDFGQQIGGVWSPSFTAQIDDGSPICVDAAVMKWGSLYPHIIVGIKTDLFKGKTMVYDCSGGILSPLGSDISGGIFTGEVAAVGIQDFNMDTALRKDVAVVEKTSATTGNLILYFPDF